MFVFKGPFFCLIFFVVLACNHNKIKTRTLTIPDNYHACNGVDKATLNFACKSSNFERGLPKNKEIFIYVKRDYCNSFTEVIKNSVVLLKPEENNCHLTRLSPYKFKLVLDSNFNDDLFIVKFILQPKKNYRIKSYWTKSIIEYPNQLEVLRNHHPVE